MHNIGKSLFHNEHLKSGSKSANFVHRVRNTNLFRDICESITIQRIIENCLTHFEASVLSNCLVFSLQLKKTLQLLQSEQRD